MPWASDLRISIIILELKKHNFLNCEREYIRRKFLKKQGKKMIKIHELKT
jgi:hypothetical protein